VLLKRSLTALFVVLLATTIVVVAEVDSAFALGGSAYQSGAVGGTAPGNARVRQGQKLQDLLPYQ
jgi:hypothetical protein